MTHNEKSEGDRRVWARVVAHEYLRVLLDDKAGSPVDSASVLLPPEHRRAVGVAVRELAAAGVIEPVGRTPGSRRRVWRIADPAAARRWAADHPLLPHTEANEERNRPCGNH
jgi:hypothetical protein